MEDTIFINQLKVTTRIGILPHEQIKKQTLIVSLELETDFTKAAQSDDILDALNYAAVVELVEQFAEVANYDLIEAFASALMREIFKTFPADAITITVQKPGAIEATRELGLKMRRERASQPNIF